MSPGLKKVQLVIPITGEGSRFKAAGYEHLKPFIKVHGKPMLEWVLKHCDGTYESLTIICREEHLNKYPYIREEILSFSPAARIISIKQFKKLGPVHDILEAGIAVSDDHPVLVSYCDYYMHWNSRVFMETLKDPDIAGAIPCYTGFHPHLLWKDNVYASCRVDASSFLIELREKYSWELDKEKALHSPGLYYFSSGKLMKEYFRKSIDSKDEVNGEFYASVPFNHMVKDGLKVWCPPLVETFCQWGTPADLEEYLRWQTVIHNRRGEAP